MVVVLLENGAYIEPVDSRLWNALVCRVCLIYHFVYIDSHILRALSIYSKMLFSFVLHV